ncbi:MAG TPA: DedA family protein [Stellaceae bacterium]|jgi:undecaprenyl-diphosphatase|nr:DedA family protein [Stellaceae bacterium]
MEGLVHAVIGFIGAHPGWVFAAMFVAAFGESLAVLSFFFPGTAILLAAGALVPSGTIAVFPLLAGAVLGALLGDACSYWIGRHFGSEIERIWPFRRHPELIARGIAFFERHGGKSVFIGRFFGPVRAVVPLAAGILRLEPARFWTANLASAVVWAPALLIPGAALGDIIARLGAGERLVPIALAAGAAIGAAAVWFALRRTRRPK